MYGNNGNGPILSETEIKFLLSGPPILDSSLPGLFPDESETTTEGPEKESIVDTMFATRKPL